MHRAFGLSVLVLLVALTQPLAAQGPATPPPLRTASGISMGQGLVLASAPPRQLTLNAHVGQFLFQPGGDSIAYVSVQGEGDTKTSTVKFVDARAKDPETRTICQSGEDVVLIGWSGNGRYLLMLMMQNFGDFVCGDVGTVPFSARPIPREYKSPDGSYYSFPEFAWSPRGRLLLFRQYAYATPVPPAFTLFDPAKGTEQVVTPGEGLDIKGWLDEGHLLAFKPAPAKGPTPVYFRHDLATGREAEIPLPKPWPPSPDSALTFPHRQRPTNVSPTNHDLTWEVQTHHLHELRRVAAAFASSLWVRDGKAPKNAAVLAVGVTPGDDNPQVQWSPDGNAVAYIAHGDLFIVTLSEREATPREKLAAGEPLSCAEERQLAKDDLLQIGAAIEQYAVADDLRLPSNAGIQDKLRPYLLDDTVFQLGKIPFVYHELDDLAITHMESPAETHLGSMDLPCARIVLYADGRVKEFPKTRQPPGGTDAP